MNILYLSQNYTKGGLETHIYSYYKKLIANNDNVYFAFGNYDTLINLGQAKIFDNFHFDNSTIKNFIEDVDRLVELIKNNDIDIIHAHPFYSLFPGLFASHLTNVPIVYTFHGRSSINFCNNINESILFQYGLEKTIKKVFCVSRVGMDGFKTVHYNDQIWLPNFVDVDDYFAHEVLNNKRWALLSRFDHEKVVEIYKIIDMVNQLDIDALDIYGVGSEEENLKKYIELKKLGNKINIFAFSSNIAIDLNHKYSGIMGVGRVALEGLSMNYPVLLIGYGKVFGLINEKTFNKLKYHNFVPDSFQEISLKNLQHQITEINSENVKNYQLRELVKEQLSSDVLFKEYYKTITNLEFYGNDNFIKLYERIKQLSVLFGEEVFYESKNIYDLLKIYVETYTTNFATKNLFLLMDNNYQVQNLLYQQTALIDELIDTMKQLDSKNNSLEYEINNLKQTIGLKRCIQNDFKKVEKKIHIKKDV